MSYKDYVPNPEATKLISSATAWIQLILAFDSPEVIPKHREKLLRHSLWMISEAEGKYNLRYRSEGALACSDESQLEHEHVFPIQSLIGQLLSAKPDNVPKILSNVIACMVTKEEHNKVSRLGKGYIGWERYIKARVPVRDMLTGKQIVSIDSV